MKKWKWSSLFTKAKDRKITDLQKQISQLQQDIQLRNSKIISGAKKIDRLEQTIENLKQQNLQLSIDIQLKKGEIL